jgi:hypothetical protein
MPDEAGGHIPTNQALVRLALLMLLSMTAIVVLIALLLP